LRAQPLDWQNPGSFREKKNKKMPYEEALAGGLFVIAVLLMR
jgi:hypothetical protein